jgi:hypothetical protein
MTTTTFSFEISASASVTDADGNPVVNQPAEKEAS